MLLQTVLNKIPQLNKESLILLTFPIDALVTLPDFVLAGFEKGLGLLTVPEPHRWAPLAVSLGAIPGALSRYYLTILFSQWLGTRFPFGTFFINLSGALFMGFLSMLVIEQVISSPELQLLMITGFLASYTTFSTYALDTSVLLRSGSRARAIFYWTGSAVFGGICLEIGIALARMVG